MISKLPRVKTRQIRNNKTVVRSETRTKNVSLGREDKWVSNRNDDYKSSTHQWTIERWLRTDITTCGWQRLSIDCPVKALRFNYWCSYRTNLSRLANICKGWYLDYWWTIVIHWSPGVQPARSAPICQDEDTRTPAFSKTMTNGLDPTKTVAEAKRTWVVSISMSRSTIL